MPAAVFISHSTQDKAAAAQVCGALEKHGIPCWIAPRDITGGKSWTQEIDSAVAASTVVVLVFSAAALASVPTEREIDMAADLNKVIVPLRMEPAPFTGGFRLTLATAQWIDAVARPLHVALEDLAHTVEFHLKGREPEAAAPRDAPPRDLAPDADREPKAAPDAPPIDVPQTLRMAQAAHLGGDRITAQRLCEEVLAAQPGHGEALILSGDLHAEQGRRGEALAQYRRAEQAGAVSRLLKEKIRRLS